MGAVVTSWGRQFHSGMVLGKKIFCLVRWNVTGEVMGLSGGSPRVVSW